MRTPGLLALLALASACSAEPTVIDGSSSDAFHASVEQARRDLPVADRLAFDAAIRKPPGSRYGMDAAEMDLLARTTYNGMTAAEVLDITR